MHAHFRSLIIGTLAGAALSFSACAPECVDFYDCADKAKWAWLADEPLDHDAWVPGTPDGSDEHCGRLIFDNGVWRYNNPVCNNHKISFICERGLQ